MYNYKYDFKIQRYSQACATAQVKKIPIKQLVTSENSIKLIHSNVIYVTTHQK